MNYIEKMPTETSKAIKHWDSLTTSQKKLATTNLIKGLKVKKGGLPSYYAYPEIKAVRYELSVDAIITNFCSLALISRADLVKKTRIREVVDKRQMIIHFISNRKHLFDKLGRGKVKKTDTNRLDIGLREIGKMMGDFDHSTIIHSTKHFSELLLSDKNIAKEYKRIKEQLCFMFGIE